MICMNVIVAVNSSQYLEKLHSLKVTHILIGDEYFSSCPNGLPLAQIQKIIQKTHKLKMKAVIRVDRLYDQKELEDLGNYLYELDLMGADCLLYSDITIKVICDKEKYKFESFYAPETLLTNSYDVKVLKEDGFNGCVISKDIPLNDVYDIVYDNPEYCYLRIFGPILISYSARRFVSVYLKETKEYLNHYYLKEESRDNLLPIVEKATGSWLYGFCLESTEAIQSIISKPFMGVIIDNILYDDDYIVKVCTIYRDLVEHELNSTEALAELKKLNNKVELVGIEDIKKTGLDKA